MLHTALKWFGPTTSAKSVVWFLVWPQSKVAITLDDTQVRSIRELVAAGRPASVSGFVQHAVDIALFEAAGWEAMLQDALQQTGDP